jgi:hypothetical protein
MRIELMNNNLKHLLILSILVSCSSKTKRAMISLDDVDETPIEQVSDKAEIINLETSGLLKVEGLEVIASSMFDDFKKYSSNSSTVISDNDTQNKNNQYYKNIVQSSEIDKVIPDSVEYIIQENDTLMSIAYRLYGDYRKWRNINNINGGLLSELNLKLGLKILVPTPNRSRKRKEKNGIPYVLQKGDTLRTVSTHAYQTPKHWKYIWNNNKSSIIDPDLIFEGFTVYYIPLKESNKNDMVSE